MLLYFKTKTCIQIEHSNIKLIFITYLPTYNKKAFHTREGFFAGNGNNASLSGKRLSLQDALTVPDINAALKTGSIYTATLKVVAPGRWSRGG